MTRPMQNDADAAIRREIGRLSDEAMVDEIMGLRADIADVTSEIAAAATDCDELKVRLAEATASGQGRIIGRLQKQLRAVQTARDEAFRGAKQVEQRLRRTDARVRELERTPIEIGASALVMRR